MKKRADPELLAKSSFKAFRKSLEKTFVSMAKPSPLITKEQQAERDLLKADATAEEIQKRCRRGALLLFEKLRFKLKNQGKIST